MMVVYLTWKSIQNRKMTSLLCVVSIALSVALLLGVERMKNGARNGFTNTISQTDLIVGSKGGPLQLVLYTIFRIGAPTNNIRYSSYTKIKNLPEVDWTIPISLGDAYRGYRVVGTDENLFKYYRYRGDKKIEILEGQIPKGIFDVVLGFEVAQKYQHKTSDSIVLSHGISKRSIMEHSNTPFRVVGVLKPTGTPIDRSVFITLEGMEALHFGWEEGVPRKGNDISPEKLKKANIQIRQITSFLLKTKNRIQTLKLQRKIDSFPKDPLMAVIPGVALHELWRTLSYVENILFLISLCVLVVGLISVIISLYTSLNERRREIAIFRALGSGIGKVVSLLMFESTLIVLMGILLGTIFLYLGLFIVRPILESNFSLYLPIQSLSSTEWMYLGGILLGGIIAGLIPAIKAYRNSLQDGLTIQA
ncbi:MAG: FtsX-like permease family protein [Candidatus Nitronauta litoralis]|uniref:FtsX-like permease family protein n=1 Tax=Candidatus Nitronauta litoralis TaxID=2705533 RepID=A0A7T0BWY0_9BACT|nr:MAG: FtsX-like permease family protein [Candidatus Nitronauta litoralis]